MRLEPKKTRKKTIGKMTNSRGTWERKPYTQVAKSQKAYSRKPKYKRGYEEEY
jgi:hypothetical protein